MSIRTKILLPITSLLFVFFGLFFYAVSYFNKIKSDINEEISAAQKINALSMRVSVLRQQSRYNTLSFRILKSDLYVRSNDYISEDITLIINEIRPLIRTEIGRQLFHEFETSREEVSEERLLLVETIKTNNQANIEKQFQTWNIKAENNQAALLDFMNYNQRLLERSGAIYENLINKIFIYQLLLTLLMSLLILATYLYLRKIITRPLHELSLIARGITKGNFNFKYSIGADDEIGVLYNNLQIMSKNLEKYQKRLIADVRRKERELQKLKQFEAQKDIFISTASHELKTPVTSLKIFEQLLKKEVDKNKDKQYGLLLKKMDEQIEKLTRLIISLLEVASMQGGRMPFKMDYFDLNKTIKGIVYVAKNKYKKHEFFVYGKVKDQVYGDKDRIGQVIENLISNAVKYSPNGNKIIMRVSQNINSATVSIKDFGIGISKRHQKKIFKRFYRVAGTDENTFPGLGIGLFISSEIIKQHKGRMWTESNKGKGSTFSFTLPMKTQT